MGHIFGQLTNKLIYQVYDEDISLLDSHLSDAYPSDKFPVTAEQVRLFNISKDPSSNSLLDVHNTEPEIEGSEDQPDVKMKVELVSYHTSFNTPENQLPKATLRLDIGQDESSSSSLRPLFWSIAAGLDLGNAAIGIDAPRKFRQDFHKTLSGRSIEVGGGLCEFRFEVVKHQEPPLWKKLFSLLSTQGSRTLAAAVGFPGIVSEAVDILNEAFDIILSECTPIFKSRPLTLALSKRAQREYTAGMNRVIIGVLSPGFCVLVPHRHCPEILDANPYFLASHGVLIPSEMSISEYAASGRDPLNHISYAVLRVRAVAAQLTPNW